VNSTVIGLFLSLFLREVFLLDLCSFGLDFIQNSSEPFLSVCNFAWRTAEHELLLLGHKKCSFKLFF
jgi:hypothetical protein